VLSPIVYRSAPIRHRHLISVKAHSGFEERCDVLHVVWAGFYGGIQTQLATLVRALQNRPGPRHRVCFLEGAGEVADALVEEGLAFRLDIRRGWSPVGLWRFAMGVQRSRPSVIHFHSSALGAALASVAVSRADRVFTQHAATGLRRTMRYRVFYGILRRFFASVVVPTPALRHSIERYGIDPERIAVLPYPLTLERLDPALVETRHEGPIIGCIARLEQEKRLDVFIDVIAELRNGGIECTGIIVGTGSKEKELAERVQWRELHDAVEFVPPTRNVTKWLDRFDCLLLTSEADVYPLVALEAMARAVPLVAMPCEGRLPELARRGGFLLPDREPANSAVAIAALLDSPAAVAECRARGTAVAAEHEPAAVVPIYDDFYREMGKS
jgi:glycosyltransferase involved in cell wall biosynthesis